MGVCNGVMEIVTYTICSLDMEITKKMLQLYVSEIRHWQVPP